MSVFSIILVFSRLLFCCVIRKFLVFSGYLGCSIAIHIGIRYQFLHFFWVLASEPPTIASGLPSAKFYSQTSSYATGHIALTIDFSNLWKHCYRFTHAYFQKVYMRVAYRYQQSLSRCIAWQEVHVQQSHASKMPATVTRSEPLKICCHVVVTQ